MNTHKEMNKEMRSFICHFLSDFSLLFSFTSVFEIGDDDHGLQFPTNH